MQTTSHLLMIRPTAFGFNPETAQTNVFQKKASDFSEEIHKKALAEFDYMVELLRKEDLNVMVIDDTIEPYKPDAVFPNNWITTHQEGVIVLYPMQAPNRRVERRTDIVEILQKQYKVHNVVNLSHYESKGKFLEGTGSMIFEHTHKIVYASLSSRTSTEVLDRFCSSMRFQPITFQALDEFEKPIYHTNVLLSVGDKFAIICMDAIKEPSDQEDLIASFRKTQKEIFKISYEQMKNFVANCLEVKNNKGERILILSERAYKHIDDSQKKRLENYVKLLPCPLDTIETYGGGSARCMIAEIFLPK